MFNKLQLTHKIGGLITITLAITVLGGFFITERRSNQQAEEAFVEKLRKTDGMASAVRTFFSANSEIYAPNKQFKDIKQVPVVVAWSVARQYAEQDGMQFTTPSLHPRNAHNAADEFETKALLAFESDPNVKEYYARSNVNGTEMMRYAQPVRLTEDCLQCHGDPAGEMGPFGYAKEGMKVGDLKGAFVVTAPLSGLNATSRANSLALVLIDLGGLLAALGAVFFVVRWIVVQPITASTALAEEIANNNLALPDIAVTSMDEIGQALVALNRMKNNLTQIVGTIGGTAAQLASASEEISATAGQTAEIARTQADQTQQAATAMHEMSATIAEISANSQTAAEASVNAANAARTGGKAVEEALSTMRWIAETTSGVAATVTELGKSSEKIGKVVSVINDIADQTNLLALNAAIEAARAGEQGRGFAVVADEVRKLAERTTKATQDIASMIATIQVETQNAVLAMEHSKIEVQSGLDKASVSGAALQDIIKMSEHVGEMITHIASAATAQSAATAEINTTVTEISSSALGSAGAAAETAKACTDLSSLAFDLQNLVKEFKVAPGPKSAHRLPRNNHTKALKAGLKEKASAARR